MEPKPLIQIVREKEFLVLAQEVCSRFFKTYNSFCSYLDKKTDINRKFYSSMIQETQFLESFLDEHGARENKTWYFFAEYVASIRNLAIAAFLIKHLLDRYPYYNLQEPEEFNKNFQGEALRTLEFINRSILNLFRETVRAGEENRLVVPADMVDPEGFAEIEINKRLPRTICDDQVKQEEDRVIDLCHRVRDVAQSIREMEVEPTGDIEKLKRLVPGKLDEKKARILKNTIHNVQSDYDTYIKNTELERIHPSLKVLRGYISLPLHLLEAALWLSHFYERHEDEVRSGECKTRISKLVDKNVLLDRIVNFAFDYAARFIGNGDKLSEEMIKSIGKTARYELPIPKPLGFHARPSTYVSLIVRQYEGGEAYMIVDGEKYNAKSVMSLLQAGGAIADKGYQTVIFEGDQRILDDIKVLAKYNYCEDQKIPRELGYLRVLRNSA
ncbi:MAG: HPr family phosphocarrier protein [Nitrospinae bacterium]|nr:HPr family phosphocarrier protein [Nitrospinota bacterium]